MEHQDLLLVRSPSARSTSPLVVVAAACVGFAFALSGAGLVHSALAPAQQLQTAQGPAVTVYVNSKTGATFTVKKDAVQPQTGAGKARDNAARMAVTGLLTLAAGAAPVDAATQNTQVQDLMQAWNAEYGAEYGQWDMSGYQFKAKTPAPAPNTVAPAVKIPQKALKSANPIEQLLAEWNKDFGAQYGTLGALPRTKSAPVALSRAVPNAFQASTKANIGRQQAANPIDQVMATWNADFGARFGRWEPVRRVSGDLLTANQAPFSDFDAGFAPSEGQGWLLGAAHAAAAVTTVLAVGFMALTRWGSGRPTFALSMAGTETASLGAVDVAGPGPTAPAATSESQPVKVADRAESSPKTPEASPATEVAESADPSVPREFFFTVGDDGQAKLKRAR